MSNDVADRILDAAGRCFAERGVRATTVGDVARAAGCSRPTVYRWFDDRDGLRAAFVHREARRLGARVHAEVQAVADPGERLVRAVLAALRGVRADPTMAAWFADGATDGNRFGASSEVIGAMARAFLDDPDAERAGWLVRVTLSLLAVPGRDETDERAMLERFVVPVVGHTPETVVR